MKNYSVQLIDSFIIWFYIYKDCSVKVVKNGSKQYRVKKYVITPRRMDIGRAGKALLYTAKRAKVAPRPWIVLQYNN